MEALTPSTCPHYVLYKALQCSVVLGGGIQSPTSGGFTYQRLELSYLFQSRNPLPRLTDSPNYVRFHEELADTFRRDH